MMAAPSSGGCWMSKKDERLRQEREIVRLMASGHPDRQIARLLAIGIRTVERRRSDLMQRIGAKNYVLLGAHAQQSGWLQSRHLGETRDGVAAAELILDDEPVIGA